MSKDKDAQGHAPEMTVEEKSDNAQDSATPAESKREATGLEEELLQHLAKTKAIFKSQQKEDPDLTFEEKLRIARCMLDKSHCLFLSKFGHFLKTEHLKYFDKSKEEDYEVSYHINRLQRYFNDSARQIDVKNRRYEALKELIEKGEYFSEKEMMKRNPLLYDHLVGQYMTEKQKKARDNIDTKNITFVNLLMESIERNGLEEKQKLQEEEERNVLEERDSDEESDETDTPKELNSHRDEQDSQTQICGWGEEIEQEKMKKAPEIITKRERQILKQEFLTNMHQSFLDGKDLDFDYSTVDDNEAYDNVELRTQDEQEKYFDSESPEIIGPTESSNQSESEDELDAYMKSLKEGIATNTVSGDNQT